MFLINLLYIVSFKKQKCKAHQQQTQKINGMLSSPTCITLRCYLFNFDFIFPYMSCLKHNAVYYFDYSTLIHLNLILKEES